MLVKTPIGLHVLPVGWTTLVELHRLVLNIKTSLLAYPALQDAIHILDITVPTYSMGLLENLYFGFH